VKATGVSQVDILPVKLLRYSDSTAMFVMPDCGHACFKGWSWCCGCSVWRDDPCRLCVLRAKFEFAKKETQ